MDTFTFEQHTPDLTTYLELRGQHPGYKYPKDADGKMASFTPTPESNQAVESWLEKLAALKAKVGADLISAYYSARKLWICRDATAVADMTQEHLSPNGKFKVVVSNHDHGGAGWNYSKGKVYEVEGDRLIETVCRNYGAFNVAWIEGHGKTGQDYLICGEDYQGQTIIELTTGKRVNFLPDSAEQGHGFCWVGVNPNADGTILAVSGCYWAYPYEVILVDFADPMSPPWTVLARDDDEHFDGWNDDGSCNIGTCFEVVDIPGHKLDGKSEDDCTMDELGVVDQWAAEHKLPEGDSGDPGWKYKTVTHLWRPGQSEVRASASSAAATAV